MPCQLIPPALFLPCAQLRGSATGRFPSGFLDIARRGATLAPLDIAGVLLGFAAVRLIQRIAALLIGILNLASLRAQHVSLPPEVHLPLLQQLRVVGYVSFLINPGVAAALFAVARRWQITASQAAGQAVAIVVVGLIHRTGMAGVSNPQGLAWRTRLAAGFCAQGCDTG